ncbi:Zinc finger BED domain-containing protein 4, partial [Nibea albiflora]
MASRASLYGNPWILLWLVSVSIIIVLSLERAFKPANSTNLVSSPYPARRRRTLENKDGCLNQYKKLELDYEEGATTTFEFDLCDAMNCPDISPGRWRRGILYLCRSKRVDSGCKKELGNHRGTSRCDTLILATGQEQDGEDHNSIKLQKTQAGEVQLSVGNVRTGQWPWEKGNSVDFVLGTAD